MEKNIRVTCRIEFYTSIDISDNPNEETIRERALNAYYNTSGLLSEKARKEYAADIIELVSIEDEESCEDIY